jgi:FkbM family methyltransferase
MTAKEPIKFSRKTGTFGGTNLLERCAALALQAGAKASASFAHRGYSIGARLVSTVINKRDIVVQLNEDALFAFPFGDGYWSLLLDRNYVYETELDRFLRSVADVDYTFIDCGANFGLWSVLVSSRTFGQHQAIAVEASSKNVERLRANAVLNGNRFEVRHFAIGRETGGTAWLTGSKHEALSIKENGAPIAEGEAVPIYALDSLIEDGSVSRGRRLIVKLDVEGVEIDAMKGGKRLFECETVIICEEHGSDRNHTVSRFILNETPYRIFVFDPKTDRFEQLIDLATLDRIKVTPSTGYNVFATTSPFWEQRLRESAPLARH